MSRSVQFLFGTYEKEMLDISHDNLFDGMKRTSDLVGAFIRLGAVILFCNHLFEIAPAGFPFLSGSPVVGIENVVHYIGQLLLLVFSAIVCAILAIRLIGLMLSYTVFWLTVGAPRWLDNGLRFSVNKDASLLTRMWEYSKFSVARAFTMILVISSVLAMLSVFAAAVLEIPSYFQISGR